MGIDLWLIILIGVLFIALVGVVAYLLGIPIPGIGGGHSAQTQMRNLVQSQRSPGGFGGGGLSGGRVASGAPSSAQGKRGASLQETAQQASREDGGVRGSKLTLPKKLKYGQTKLTPGVVHILKIIISIVVSSLVAIKMDFYFVVFSLLSGPLVMGWYVNRRVNKRFMAFDADYPQFLMSLVGLLKTGMGTMSAIKAAAEGLDESSLVRSEVELMNERLRFGVSEEVSIGAFAEDVHHPEIELYVQALLLSRSVGGQLSDTLERLAKQVRKRQYFRASASAAVGMQRGSIWFIIVILVGLEGYLGIVYPQAVTGVWEDEMGWKIWQGCFMLIILGIYWVSQVTKIKI